MTEQDWEGRPTEIGTFMVITLKAVATSEAFGRSPTGASLSTAKYCAPPPQDAFERMFARGFAGTRGI